MSVTVGAVLREKLPNMVKWVHDETGIDVTDNLDAVSDTQLAYAMGRLADERPLVTHKDWGGLARTLRQSAELTEIIDAVRKREDMHDKFWRYMELFVDTIKSNP